MTMVGDKFFSTPTTLGLVGNPFGDGAHFHPTMERGQGLVGNPAPLADQSIDETKNRRMILRSKDAIVMVMVHDSWAVYIY